MAGTRAAEISLWYRRTGAPGPVTRRERHPHYAASLVKVPAVLAAHREHELGRLDLDTTVPVHDDLPSAVPGPRVRADRGRDEDPEVWRYLGRPVSLRWLCARAIVASSNLAFDLLLDRLGTGAIARVAPEGPVVGRAIADRTAAAAGITNTATAEATGRLLAGLADGRVAGPRACAQVQELLAGQQHRDGLLAGVPGGVRVGGKGGWAEGVRHDAVLVRPDDAPEYVLAVLTTGLPDDRALDLLRSVSAAVWRRRADGSAVARFLHERLARAEEEEPTCRSSKY